MTRDSLSSGVFRDEIWASSERDLDDLSMGCTGSLSASLSPSPSLSLSFAVSLLARVAGVAANRIDWNTR